MEFGSVEYVISDGREQGLPHSLGRVLRWASELVALRALAYPFGLINSWNIEAFSAVGDGWTASRPARTIGMNSRILRFHPQS